MSGIYGGSLSSIPITTTLCARTAELGFFNCIGTFAAFYQQQRGDQFYRDYLVRADQQWDEGEAELAKIRSDRARKAAKARWAKTKRKAS